MELIFLVVFLLLINKSILDVDLLESIPTNYQFRNASHEERLLAYLFQDYEPVARAVLDVEKPVTVSISFILLRIHGLEERNQVLTTTGLIIAEWVDERLTWDPAMFGNVKDIILKSEKIWQPELAVMNGAEELIHDFDRIRVLLNHTGHLHWEPGGIFRTTCDIDIAHFPFDMQHCPIIIGAYSYYSNRMNITNATNEVSTFSFQENGEWKVDSTEANWNITELDGSSGNGYAHVVFMLHLNRRCRFYMMNIVLPCIMLSALILVGFFLPPEAGEKISLGISVLLAYTVFLLMIADSIPRTSLAIPLIVLYLMSTMTLGTISICMTVLVLNIHHRDPKPPLNPKIRYIFLYQLARIMRIDTNYRLKLKSVNESKNNFKNDIWKRRDSCTNSHESGKDTILKRISRFFCFKSDNNRKLFKDDQNNLIGVNLSSDYESSKGCQINSCSVASDNEDFSQNIKLDKLKTENKIPTNNYDKTSKSELIKLKTVFCCLDSKRYQNEAANEHIEIDETSYCLCSKECLNKKTYKLKKYSNVESNSNKVNNSEILNEKRYFTNIKTSLSSNENDNNFQMGNGIKKDYILNLENKKYMNFTKEDTEYLFSFYLLHNKKFNSYCKKNQKQNITRTNNVLLHNIADSSKSTDSRINSSINIKNNSTGNKIFTDNIINKNSIQSYTGDDKIKLIDPLKQFEDINLVSTILPTNSNKFQFDKAEQEYLRPRLYSTRKSTENDRSNAINNEFQLKTHQYRNTFLNIPSTLDSIVSSSIGPWSTISYMNMSPNSRQQHLEPEHRDISSLADQICQKYLKVSNKNNENLLNEWKDLVKVMDRFFFWIITVLMTLSTLMILFYPSYYTFFNNGNK